VELWFGQVGHLAGSEGEARTLPQDSPFEDSLSEPLLSCAKELTRWAERELGLEERMELDSRVRRLEELASLVQSFCSKGGDNEVRWTERRRQQGRPLRSAGARRPSPRRAALGQGRPGQAPGLGHARPA
jgi:hypothetical protein